MSFVCNYFVKTKMVYIVQHTTNIGGVGTSVFYSWTVLFKNTVKNRKQDLKLTRLTLLRQYFLNISFIRICHRANGANSHGAKLLWSHIDFVYSCMKSRG